MHSISFFETDNGGKSFAEQCIAVSKKEEYQSYFIEKEYSNGEWIRTQGENITQLGIVTAGILKAVSYAREGNELCLTYFERGDSFPEFLYLTGSHCYTYELYAEKKSSVLWMSIAVLQELLTKDMQLMGALLYYVSQRGLKNQLYLHCFHYQTIRERIAYWIVGIKKIEPGYEITIPYSQRVFANMIQVSRSSLNQELKQMEREGYFCIKKEKICEIEVERLTELL